VQKLHAMETPGVLAAKKTTRRGRVYLAERDSMIVTATATVVDCCLITDDLIREYPTLTEGKYLLKFSGCTVLTDPWALPSSAKYCNSWVPSKHWDPKANALPGRNAVYQVKKWARRLPNKKRAVQPFMPSFAQNFLQPKRRRKNSAPAANAPAAESTSAAPSASRPRERAPASLPSRLGAGRTAWRLALLKRMHFLCRMPCHKAAAVKLAPGVAARTGGEDVVLLGCFSRRGVHMADVMPVELHATGYRGNKKRVTWLGLHDPHVFLHMRTQESRNSQDKHKGTQWKHSVCSLVLFCPRKTA
jgi:hypothetical protein